MSFLALLNSTLAIASAADLAAVENACNTPDVIKGKVEYCDQNSDAVAAALSCKSALKRMWDNAPNDVDPAFARLFKNNDGKQQLNFNDSHTDYQTTMSKLDEMIVVTKKKTALVADYPLVMVDYPGAPALTAPCYNVEVDKIYKIVGEMDDMILQGKATYAEAGRLRGVGVDRDDHINASVTNFISHGVQQPSAPPPRNPLAFTGESPRQGSDITGTREEKEKEMLGSFVLRGQLTGSH